MTTSTQSYCGLRAVASFAQDPNVDMKEDRCLICQSSYEEIAQEKSPIIRTDCGKYLHYACVQDYFKSNPTSGLTCLHCQKGLSKHYVFKEKPNQKESNSYDWVIDFIQNLTISLFKLKT